MSKAGLEREAARKAAPKKPKLSAAEVAELKKGKRKGKIKFLITAERAPFYTGDADLFEKTLKNLMRLYSMTFDIGRREFEEGDESVGLYTLVTEEERDGA